MLVEGAGTMEVALTAIAEMPASLRQLSCFATSREDRPRKSVDRGSLDPDEERDRLHRAPGVVRARLERHFERTSIGDAS